MCIENILIIYLKFIKNAILNIGYSVAILAHFSKELMM